MQTPKAPQNPDDISVQNRDTKSDNFDSTKIIIQQTIIEIIELLQESNLTNTDEQNINSYPSILAIEDEKIGLGIWKRYGRESTHDALINTIKDTQANTWNTFMNIEKILKTNDIYICYTIESSKLKPSIILQYNNTITEIRGAGYEHNIESGLWRFLEKIGTHIGGYNKNQEKKIEDIKKLEQLYERCFIGDTWNTTYTLTSDDICFITGKVGGFGVQPDPRIHTIQEHITHIPDGCIFRSNIDMSTCPHLKSIGENVEFQGKVILNKTSIEHIGNNTKFHKDVHFLHCAKLKELPIGLVFEGSVWLNNSAIQKIPDNTQFKQDVDCTGCKKLTSIGNNVHFGRKVTFDFSQLTHIPDNTTFLKHASFVGCNQLKNMGTGHRFMKSVDFSGSGIEKIPDNIKFPQSALANFTGCQNLTTIGNNVVFLGSTNFDNSGITEIPVGTKFFKDVSFEGCHSLTKIGNNTTFKANVNFRNSGIKIKPEGVSFRYNPRFSEDNNQKNNPQR